MTAQDLGAVVLIALVGLSGCRKEAEANAIATVGGNLRRGTEMIGTYGCASCHTIPGIRGANGVVGPPLTQMGARSYVGGVLQNTPDNLVRWIQNPTAVDPKTAMPNLHVTNTDARDIATYLDSLQ
jgi:cytochrome c